MKISLKKIIIFTAGLLAIATFVMMFVTPLTMDLGILGTYNYDFKEVYFPEDDKFKFLWPTVIAFALALLSGIGLLLTCLKSAKNVKLIRFISSVLLIAIGIVLFCTLNIYIGVNELSEETAELVELGIGIGPILGGVFSIVAGLSTLVVGFALKD